MPRYRFMIGDTSHTVTVQAAFDEIEALAAARMTLRIRADKTNKPELANATLTLIPEVVT